MYHDQGHGPVKVFGAEAGVNITVGLPVIRTSVDHGTAFDIAGKGVAGMRTNDRRDEIVRMATTTGLAGVEELAFTFDVTASTIRRGLARLTDEGRVAARTAARSPCSTRARPSVR